MQRASGKERHGVCLVLGADLARAGFGHEFGDHAALVRLLVEEGRSGKEGSGYLDDDGEFGGARVGVRSVEAEHHVRFHIDL